MLGSLDEATMQQAFIGVLSETKAASACPSADELWLTCTAELDLERRLEVIDHCHVCAVCAHAMSATRQMVQGLGEELDLIRRQEEQGSAARVHGPRLSLVEGGHLPVESRGLDHIPGDRNSRSADQARLKTSVVNLAAWRDKLRPLGLGFGAAAVAALAVIVVMQPRDADSIRGIDVRRGGENVSGSGQFEYANRTFSWPSQEHAERFELEIKNPSSSATCYRVATTNSLVVNPEDCPATSLSELFVWRVRPVGKDGPGTFSSYQSVHGSSSIKSL